MTPSDIISAYVAGTGMTTLSAQTGLHRGTIQRLLLRADVVLRKRTPSIEYDKSFFDRYTSSSCYWAGFILADGCVASKRAKVSVHLANVDYEHLVKMASVIKFPIAKIYCNKTCCLNVHGEWYPRALLKNFEISPQKSLTIAFPTKIPEELHHHLIRGIVDGDGSIGSLPNQGGPTLNIVGTPMLLQSIADIFYSRVGIRLKSRNTTPPIQMTSKAGLIFYSGRNAERILTWLYTDSDEQIRLRRKYEKWLKVRKS